MPDDFSDFEDLELRPLSRTLPDQAVMLGAYGEEMRAFLVDGDRRLILETATPVYYARLPVVVPTSAGVLESAPSSGVRNVLEINVVNVTSSDVTLTLYFRDDTPSSTHIFGANAVVVPANGSFQWQGLLTLETKHVYGVASAGSSLYAFFTVRDEIDSFRE